MSMKALRVLGISMVMILALAFVAACNGDDDGDVANGNGSITIETPSLSYDPDSISMNAGENLEVTVDNTDTQLHTFTIDELGIDLEVDAGESGSVTIEAPDAGEYEFYCTVPGHREAGQVGTLTVN
jgi:plastocyanin